MIKKERRSYDKSFKQMAVELCRNGKSPLEVGEDLGIRSNTTVVKGVERR